MHFAKRLAIVMLSGAVLLVASPLPTFAASPSPAPSGNPAPQFTLQAGVGHFPPQSSLAFMDNVVNNIELLFKFSTDSKDIKRMDIADKKMVHMKLSEENSNNVAQVTEAATDYKSQITAITNTLTTNTSADLKNQLKDRARHEDEAFQYLFSISNDKTNPILKDAWSSLQNLESALNK